MCVFNTHAGGRLKAVVSGVPRFAPCLCCFTLGRLLSLSEVWFSPLLNEDKEIQLERCLAQAWHTWSTWQVSAATPEAHLLGPMP